MRSSSSAPRRGRTLVDGEDSMAALGSQPHGPRRLARREAELALQVDGARIGFRASAVEQANEPDAERRARIEDARLAAIEEALNPLHEETLATHHALARELGWSSYRAMCAECKGIDLEALERQTAAFA